MSQNLDMKDTSLPPTRSFEPKSYRTATYKTILRVVNSSLCDHLMKTAFLRETMATLET